MVAFILPANTESAAYEIDNSLRFNDDDSAVLTRTLSTAGNLKTWTFSCWFKMGNLVDQQLFTWWDHNAGATNNQHWLGMISGQLEFKLYNGPANTHYGRLLTNQVLRDTSAWYHLTAVWDTSNATSGDRMRLYLNGTRIDSFSVETYPALNTDGYVNTTAKNATIGAALSSAALYVDKFDGYLSEVNFVDGSALAPTEFGKTNNNGVWIPKAYSGSYGTNGFFLEFKQTGTSQNSSGMGADTSGNDNHFAVTNLAATDVTTDTPTNNFCTMNYLHQRESVTASQGNLRISLGTNSSIAGTHSINSGKWYFEAKIQSGEETMVGWINPDISTFYTGYTFGQAGNLLYYAGNGSLYKYGSSASYGASYGGGTIIGCALDLDNNQITFYKNNVSQGTISINAGNYIPYLITGGGGGDWSLCFSSYDFSVASGNSDANGYGNFEYAVPSGYYSLCTKNLAEFG